jgi:hypothetical protein
MLEIRSGPSLRFLRSERILRSSRAWIRCGQRRGRLDRSSRPSSPSANQRRHHLSAVFLAAPISAATWGSRPARSDLFDEGSIDRGQSAGS